MIDYFLTRNLILILVVITALKITISKGNDDEHVKTLWEMNKQKSIVILTQNEFEDLIKPSPRSFSAIVLFTALDPKRDCVMCVAAHREYEHVAKLWKNSKNYSNHLFFTNIDVDFGNGIEVIKSLGLTHAPVILHFAANRTQKKFDVFEPQKQGYGSEVIAKWIQESTGIDIKIEEIVDYRIFMAKFGVGIFSILFLFLCRNHFVSIMFSHYLWSLISIAFILIFVSGQVWNNIRSPPFSRNNPKTGGKMYVAPINNFQFIAETYGVLFLYLMISLCFIIINQSLSFTKTTINLLLMTIGILIGAFCFCLLLFLFETKTKGYPYGISSLITINYKL